MKSRRLSGILWNLLSFCLIITKSRDIFFDINGPLSMAWQIFANILIIIISFLLFKIPSINFRELEMIMRKEIVVKLKITTYLPYIILIVNLFNTSSCCYSVRLILYLVVLLLYLLLTTLQILVYSKYKEF
jgi:hypothetical protein